MTVTKVNARYQIIIPRIARKRLNINPGDRLLFDVQAGIIVLIPRPKNYTKYLQGLHTEIWKGINAQNYLAGEREAWVSLKSLNRFLSRWQ